MIGTERRFAAQPQVEGPAREGLEQASEILPAQLAAIDHHRRRSVVTDILDEPARHFVLRQTSPVPLIGLEVEMTDGEVSGGAKAIGQSGLVTVVVDGQLDPVSRVDIVTDLLGHGRDPGACE